MSFYGEVIVNLPLFHSTSIVNDLNYLEPVFRNKITAILQDAAAAGTPLMVFETYRSQERQEALFKQGATQLDTVGVHHYGLAADLVKDVGGQPSWKGDFTFLRDLAVKYDMISGLDWGNPKIKHGWVDACHVQRISVRDQARLFDGSWYPTPTYRVVQ